MDTTSDPIEVTRFTTDAFAPADRHEAWANRDWPAIGPVFDTTPIGSFYNRADRFALGPITVHLADMAPQRYHRSAGRARRDGVDGLMVEILLSGATQGEAAGAEFGNVAGGMAFNDLAQGHSHISTGTKTLLMSLPRTLAERNGIDVRALHGVHISPEAASLLRSHLLGIHQALQHLSRNVAPRLGQTIVDLITVALDVDGLRAPGASAQARHEAARLAACRFIEANLGSPQLGVEWLCRQLAVPRSRLYRLFEDDGGVQAYIRDQRLERVRTHLEVASVRGRMADLAERYGFSDTAHLSRTFRGRFGMTPGEYRALYGQTRSEDVLATKTSGP